MRWLDGCFGSLRASQLPVSVIAIDNGSTDGTVEALRERFPEVEIVETGENLGFGRANNIGMSLARDRGCDYVYLLNQDAWVDPDTIGQMIEIHRANPEYFVLSPMQITGNRSKFDAKFGRRLTERKCPGYPQDVVAGALKPVYTITFAMAAHWLLPRRTLDVVGGFAPIFPHRGEDNNYIQRVKFFGGKVGICPAVSGVHDREYRPRKSREGAVAIRYVNFMMKACDINHGAVVAYAAAVCEALVDVTVYSLRYLSLRPFAMLFKALRATPVVMETRRRTRLADASYL
jgi:GT2 family glycosyltransferase